MSVRFQRWWRMSSEGTVANMRLQVMLAQLVSQWFRVIGFVRTDMLKWILALWTGHDRMLQQVHHRQVVIGVGWDNLNSQRCASLVHPEMTFRAQFGSIRGIRTR